jgi:hypothetical protein
MSSREQKLLIFFAVAGFLVINFLLIGFLNKQKIKATAGLVDAKNKLQLAERISDERDQVADEMDWLDQNLPDPAAEQDIQTKLNQLGMREATNNGLTIKSQKPLPAVIKEGRHFQRALFQFTLSGSEEALYKWFNAINMPDQLRIASIIRLSPNTQDDTKIDCVATVAQAFIPATGEEEDDADAEADSEQP